MTCLRRAAATKLNTPTTPIGKKLPAHFTRPKAKQVDAEANTDGQERHSQSSLGWRMQVQGVMTCWIVFIVGAAVWYRLGDAWKSCLEAACLSTLAVASASVTRLAK